LAAEFAGGAEVDRGPQSAAAQFTSQSQHVVFGAEDGQSYVEPVRLGVVGGLGGENAFDADGAAAGGKSAPPSCATRPS
jgi:hypothetical protein